MNQHVYICSQPRNGSTLLSLLMGSHPSVFSAGELNLFGEMLKTNAACSCGAQLLECNFWSEIIQNLFQGEVRSADIRVENFITQCYPFNYPQKPVHHLIAGIYTRALQNQNKLFAMLSARFAGTYAFDAACAVKNHEKVVDTIFTQSEKRDQVVLDSTKTSSRLLELLLKSPATLRVIVLLRDGRGSVNSYLKSGNTSFEEVVSSWQYHMEKQRQALDGIGETIKLTVKYEDLCENPEKSLLRICRFLNIPFDPGMLEITGPFHSLGGNYPAYQKKVISLDDEWKRKLTEEQLAIFDKIGGDTNRMNGYC
ncbi:MAG: sulfotransferase [Bacteroidales bacterium]|nr:sulfotransferase [Bacteroidales bacterium]